MNFRAGFVVMVLLFVSFLVSESEGIKCYRCQLCNDPFDSNGVSTTDCSGSCVKYKTSQGVIRECSPVPQDDTCASVTYNGESVEGCVCSSNLCNAGSVKKLSDGMALMMVTVLSILKIMY